MSVFVGPLGTARDSNDSESAVGRVLRNRGLRDRIDASEITAHEKTPMQLIEDIFDGERTAFHHHYKSGFGENLEFGKISRDDPEYASKFIQVKRRMDFNGAAPQRIALRDIMVRSNMDTIDIGGLGSWESGDIMRAVAVSPNVKTLILRRSEVQTQLVRRLGSITSLQLRNCRFVGDDLVEAVCSLTGLTSLGLEDIIIAYDHLSKILESLTSLTSLSIDESTVIGASPFILLGKHARITSLSIRKSLGDPESLAELSKLVHLTSLNISFNSIGDAGARALSALVNLNSLDASYDRITTEGALSLTSLVHMKTLNLKGNDIGPAAIEALRAAMRQLVSLEVYV